MHSQAENLNPLATIETISEVIQHPNADRLEIVKVRGFECIVPIGAHTVGERVILVHPDAQLPDSPEQAWAQPYLKYCGSKNRVKAAKLRGVWSMGIVVPFIVAPGGVGDDVSEWMGVTKYEPPLPKNVNAKGGLPFGIPKTDQISWQNAPRMIAQNLGEPVEVSWKIDGSSTTVYCRLTEDGPVTGVCSRSLELKNDPEFTNQWLEAVRNQEVIERLTAYCLFHKVSVALRGELYGAGVQAFAHNPHAKGEKRIAFYDSWLIDERRSPAPGDQHYYRMLCMELGLEVVPAVEHGSLTESLIKYYDSMYDSMNLDGNMVPFEGVVVRGKFGSFKIINKHYDSRK